MPFRSLVVRTSRVEALEDRLAFSAEPIDDPWLPTPQEAATRRASTEIATPDDGSTVDYGLEYVRRVYGLQGAGQTVAIIDSGIAYDHPALGGGLGTAYRVVGGWDFAENDADPYDDAPGGFHGTHVAGIVGSSDALHRGVAPGVDLVALRVLDDQGYGEIAWIEQALRWVHERRNAFENPITIVNLSLGSKGNAILASADAQLEDELALLKADGILVVASAGNSFRDFAAPGLNYPASSSSVVPVASVDAQGVLSDFSQRSPRVIAAPGERITSTVPDFARNLDGVANDFERSTGTSMAAPFVAGAAALVREAMELSGRAEITGDALYDHLRQTADRVFDPVTNAYYHRINVGRAIDAAMPPDDFGSTAATAHVLGTLSGVRTVSGLLGRTDDVDYFQFVAAETGTVNLYVQTASGATPEWRWEGGAQRGDALTLDVVAGRAYAVGLAANGSTGRYAVSLEPHAAPVAIDWGAVTFQQYASQAFAGGETSRTVRAARTGILTVEAFFSQANGNIDLELYDERGQQLAASRSRTDNERLDVEVAAGQTLSLKIVGANADVKLRLTNLVTAAGGGVEVMGTERDDTFRFAAGEKHLVEVNGVEYRFLARDYGQFRFRGGRGEDAVSLTGTAENERLTARSDGITFAGASWTVSAHGAASLHATGGGGSDRAIFFDSPGDDRFYGAPGEGRLIGDGFEFHAAAFDVIEARARAGHDVAFLTDSPGDDAFSSRPDRATLAGAGFRLEVAGFDAVRATATRGDDRATLYDSAGSERFFARPGMAWMLGRESLNYAAGFDAVRAYATAGGYDLAWLVDSRQDDRLVARPGEASLTGPGFHLAAMGFDIVRAASAAGGQDRAEFFRSTGDALTHTPTHVVQRTGEYTNVALGFSQIRQTQLPEVRQAAFQTLALGDDEGRTLSDSLPLAPARTCRPAMSHEDKSDDDWRPQLQALASVFDDYGA